MDIVFPLFGNVTQLDFTGPAQVLSRLPRARIHVAAATLDPVPTDCGFGIMPTVSFADCPPATVLCVPGGHGVADALGDPALLAFIADQASHAAHVTSVCTGAFLLGAAGLLKGRRATTHWAYVELLPLVGAIHQPGRVVRDGRVMTGGGVTAGIDFGLTLVAEIAGEDRARAIQLALEYDPAPPFASGNPELASAATRDMVGPIYDGARERMRDAILRNPA